jgi:hypothetical protein
MKKLIAFCALIALFEHSIAQTVTGRIEGLKDAWGTTISYIGEIKNKQPNGLGIAIYSNDFTLRYSGYFVNGLYNGKGVMLFKDGTFLSGDWKNGKLNGKGVNLNKEGDLYIGSFADGKKDGLGTYFFSDKSLLVGSMKNDVIEGRSIYIPASGKTINDNIYVNGKKNGTGYQYEIDSKTLYEGSWNDGNWVSSGTASYMSFLKDNTFYAEKTDAQILMGGIDKTNNNELQDTSFFYDIQNDSRYFGYCDKGLLRDGVIIKDSSRFLGTIKEDGAYGPCSFYKVKKFYDEGNYQNDYLAGNNSLSINLDKLTVYYGTTIQRGLFSGKGWFCNNSNELYVGNFDNGAFTGTGYIIYKNGKTVKGTFRDGDPTTITSITDENGVAIPQKPKTFSQALSLVVNEFDNNYHAFRGDEADEDEYADYYDAYNSIISFPNTAEPDVILEDFDFYLMYNATVYSGVNYEAAVAKYNELCKTLSAVSLNLKVSKTPVTLSGTVVAPEKGGTTHTQFTLNNYPSLSDFNVYVELKYDDDDNYKVSLIAGDVSFDD